MYDRILVTTDGSDVSAVAIDHAVDLAETYGAEVHALYVVDLDATSYGLGAEEVERIRAGRYDELPEIVEDAERATGRVAESGAARGVAVVERTVTGRPHEEIVDYAAENDVDLVVMGSRGRSGASRALLGSVTERVLRSTAIPVLVVGARRA